MAGLYYEEFEIGKKYEHEWTRTVPRPTRSSTAG